MAKTIYENLKNILPWKSIYEPQKEEIMFNEMLEKAWILKREEYLEKYNDETRVYSFEYWMLEE